MNYENLFTPGYIGGLRIKNRVVMTAMGALMGDWNGCTTPEQIRANAKAADIALSAEDAMLMRRMAEDLDK